MRLFTCTDHELHWSVGGASVVVANDEEEARRLLSAELRAHSLVAEKPFTLQEISLEHPVAIVLADGNY